MTNQPLNQDALEAAARAEYPHLFDGKLENGLARLPIFTAQQARESTEKKRSEKIETIKRHASAYLAAARPVVNSVDELPIGTVFFDSCNDFAYQIISNGEQGPEGREIVSVGIEERYEPSELDYPLTVLQGPVK